MPDPQTRPLGDQILRTVGVFQAIVAFPISLFLGTWAWFQLLEGAWMGFYYFISDFTTALMAAFIIFVVLVQRKVEPTKMQTLVFEAVKTVLATGLWVWLLVDSAISSWPQRRIPTAATASILLVVFFYPVLGYAIVQVPWEEHRSGSNLERAEEGSERTPLLSQ